MIPATMILHQIGERPVVARVYTWADASHAVREFVEERLMGASQMGEHFGEVKNRFGKKIGRVSYNGRCWNPDGDEIPLTSKD